MPKPDELFGYSIFCDDIRQEVANKLSYIGVYGSTMLTECFPINLPKFCVHVSLYEPLAVAEARTQAIIVRLFGPGESQDEIISTAELPPIPQEQLGMIGVSLLPDDPDSPRHVERATGFIVTPFVVTRPGRLKVRAFSEEAIIKLGAISIEQALQT